MAPGVQHFFFALQEDCLAVGGYFYTDYTWNRTLHAAIDEALSDRTALEQARLYGDQLLFRYVEIIERRKDAGDGLPFSQCSGVCEAT